MGFIVPKHKRTGVERNRLKRRLRELVRTRMLAVLPPADVVIRPQPHAYDASFDALALDVEKARDAIARIFRRAAP